MRWGGTPAFFAFFLSTEGPIGAASSPHGQAGYARAWVTRWHTYPEHDREKKPNPWHIGAYGGLHLTAGGRQGLTSTTRGCNLLR